MNEVIKMEIELKTGDVVKLKGHTTIIPMTVGAITVSENGMKQCVCDWHCDNGSPFRATYLVDQLQKMK